ncbi:MAG TPA: pyridoxal phosphate-dependent aminotransferase [Gemmatimonadaceae bacterium]|nr:pyridoxal phosphate-dependent aminotransferase [Gemmatimonadaceae bacterium]
MHFRPEVVNVAESPLVQIATAAEQMPGSIKLCYGESDIPTPEFICRAAADALRAGHTFYTHTAGYPELREAIAAKVGELHGVTCRPSQVMATVGASMAIFTAIRACVGPGDNAVIISPAYAIFSNAVVLAGAEPRNVPLARDGSRFRLDMDRVKRAIDGGTRMLIVNSPSNPTGWVSTVEEQRMLAELAERHDLMILSDEVYERLVFDQPIAPSFARISDVRDRLIVVNSFSKTYNMTGWRLGWAQASEPTIRLMYKAAEFMTSNASAMVQQAGIVALRDGEAYVRELREDYARRRTLVVDALSSIPRVSLSDPQGAFYAFFKIDGLTDSAAFAGDILRECGVALAPGAGFGEGGEGYIRLCFAASESTLSNALARFRTFMVERGDRYLAA